MHLSVYWLPNECRVTPYNLISCPKSERLHRWRLKLTLAPKSADGALRRIHGREETALNRAHAWIDPQTFPVFSRGTALSVWLMGRLPGEVTK